MDRETATQGRSNLPRHLFGVPLAFLPLVLGGARPWLWSVVAGVFAINLGWHAAFGREPWSLPVLSRKWLVAMGLLLAYPFFQILPLPASWLALLSPHALMWKELAGSASLVATHFFSISYSPLATLFSGLWWVFLAAFVLLFARFADEEANLIWFCRLVFWIAGIEALYGLLQALIPSLGVLWESPGQGVARGTFVNRNHYAAFLGMVWPVLLAYMFSPMTARSGSRARARSSSSLEEHKEARQRRWFLGFLVGLVLLSLVFSLSRAGIMGALISLTVFVVAGKKQRQPGLVVFLAGCWLVMLVYGSIIGFGNVLSRFAELETDSFGRGKIWEESWQLIQDHWLTGTGLGTFPEVIRVYQSHLSDQFDIVHAHSDYMELAGELGLPVASGMALLVWGYWWVCARRFFKRGTSEQVEQETRSREDGNVKPVRDSSHRERERLLALGALAGSAAFLFHSWVEFNWQIPANQLYFLVLLVLMKPR